MRAAFHLLPATLLASLATAIQLPDLQPFLSALPNLLQDYIPQTLLNGTAEEHELLKRQYSNTCPDDFNSCSGLGAPNLCCMSNAVCSADYAGMVACCPSGAACTGTIAGIISSGTMNSNGGLIGGATTSNSGLAASTAATTTSFQLASSTTNGLIQATSAATVATDDGSAGTNSGFIVVSSTVVATPGAAVRGLEIPWIAQVIIRFVDYLPI